jgi:hypothetical protein
VEHDLASISATHVDAIATIFDVTLARVIRDLQNPRTIDSDRIDKLIGSVVEAAVGFAIGLAAGEVATAIDVWFGRETANEVRTAIQRGPATPGQPVPVFTSRTVIADLEARLRFRLRIATGQLRTLIEHALRVVPPGRERALVAALAMARQTSLLGERLGSAINHGWQFACAAIDGTQPPVLDRRSPSYALWEHWSRLAGVAAKPVFESYIVTM